MAEKFNNKYRIESARLQTWDYGWNASYFVTICTHKRIHFFGEIHNKIVELSEIGKIAHDFWIEIPNHFPFVELGEFVIMPNHVHGIITINKKHENVKTAGGAVETPKLGVSTIATPGVPIKPPTSKKNDKWKSGTLGVILNQFKRICTINARKINPRFEWQERYYDPIIRDEIGYRNVTNYIKDNPFNWEKDEFF